MTTQTAPTHSTLLSAAQVRSFVENGFLVMPGLVSPSDIERLKRDTADIARGAYPSPSLTPVPPETTDREVQEKILCIHQPHYVSPVIREFVSHPGICAVLAQVVGAHLPFWDQRVKCMQSMLFTKPPGLPGQAWHQDEYYIPTRDRSLCGAWIAIDDATIQNGCLWVVPGSHRMGYLYPAKPPADLDEYDGSNCCYGFDEALATPVEVTAGSVVFFNGYLLHRSLRNRSDIYRRALVCHYMNAWSLLPWGDFEDKLRAGETRASAANYDFRTVVQVAGADPYAEKGYSPGHDVWLRPYNKPWQADLAPG
jgi:phytanoyl-CoA hydroxylase